MKRIWFLVFLILFCFRGVINSQIKYGLPQYKLFNLSHPQIFTLAQLGDGRILIGNPRGIYMYDGDRFVHILSNRVINTIKVDTVSRKERICYGGFDGFGYLEKDSSGLFVEKSFSDKLPKKYGDYIFVLSIEKKDSSIYFSSIKRVFIYKNDTLYKTIEAGKKNKFDKLFKIYNRLFLFNYTNKIVEIKNDTFVKLPNLDTIKREELSCMYPAGNNKVYIAGGGKIYLYDLSSGRIVIVHSVYDKYFSKNYISVINRLKDGNWVVGTKNGGLVVTDISFSPLFVMNTTNTLENNHIYEILVDKQGNIWFASNNGAGVIYYSDKIMEINNKLLGMSSNFTKLKRVDNSFYLSTFNGIFKYGAEILPTNENKFIGFSGKTKLFSGNVFNFVQTSNNEFLLCGITGLYSLRNDTDVSKIASFPGFTMLKSIYDSTIVYVSISGGIALLKKQEDEWRVINKMKLNSTQPQILEFNPYVLYLALRGGKLMKVVFDKTYTNYKVIKEIDLASSLRTYSNKRSDFFLLNDTLFLMVQNFRGQTKVLYFNESRDTLLPWHYKIKFERNADIKLLPATHENYVLKKDTTYIFRTDYTFTRLRIHSDTIIITNKEFRSLKSNGIFSIYFDKEKQTVWGVSTDKLYNFPYNYYRKEVPYNCLITSVTTLGDSVIAVNNVNPVTVLDYKYSSLTFYYAAPFFENSDSITYSYFMEGFDENWSSWTKGKFTKYTNLPPGDYTFRVKAKNVYGEESREATYRFTVLPPWYLTWWAYMLYVLFGVIFIVVIVRLYSYRLKKANERLEIIVRERNKELYHKNELITHSIEYAKKIQDAILPSENEVKKVFSDAFVFFRPKDIVSGDFYWFYRVSKDEVIVVLSDCTGHGVPGAFMSMIGISLLNEIVKDKRIYDPSKILLELHKRVKKSLQSKTELTDTFDGMDIAVLRINFKEKQVELSSANQYVFVIKGDNVETYLGDIYSIGDPLAREEIKFNAVRIDFDKDTIVYLTSDGFLDQFGGEGGSKYSAGKFVELLKRIKDEDFEKQRERIMKEFDEWKSGYAQLDDVLVIGIKIEPKS